MDLRRPSFETARRERCEMPIYEYACDKCETEFEVEQRITDAPIKSCPRCKSRKIRRLISRTSFVLKGGGWYSDLYSSSVAKDDKTAKADSSDGVAANANSEPKTEPKSESKSESKSADTPKTKDKPSAKRKGGSKGGKAVA